MDARRLHALVLSLLLSVLCTVAAVSGGELGSGVSGVAAVAPAGCVVGVRPPAVALTGVQFPLNLTLATAVNSVNALPEHLYVEVLRDESIVTNTSTTLNGVGVAGETNWAVVDSVLKAAGSANLTVRVFLCMKGSSGHCTFGCSSDLSLSVIPGVLSVLPPILTLLFAVLFKQVFIALFLGVWLGALFLNEYNAWTALLRAADTYTVRAVSSTQHSAVIVFTFLLGGLIGVVQRSGGAVGLARMFTSFTTTPRRASLASFALCLLIFFDDYSSILIVGCSLRSVAVAGGVSLERFSFIIHTMGVSLASISPVSSWVGVELGYVASAFDSVGVTNDPFVTLLQSIPYRVFPVMCVLLVLLVICMGVDLGPMATVEEQAQIQMRESPLPINNDVSGDGMSTDGDAMQSVLGPLAPVEGKPRRAINAVLPFAVVIGMTFGGMYVSGVSAIPAGEPVTLVNAFSKANSLGALIWASLLGCIVAIVLSVSQRILTLAGAMEAWVNGIKDVLEPTMVLVLAWALGAVIADVSTGPFIAGGVGSQIPVGLLPFITSVLSLLMSYACGTAFGAMGVLFPLVVPVVVQLTNDESLRVQCIAAILGSTTFGNICSPIADNTILTAMATKCDLASHVKTITPYAILVAGVTLVFAELPQGLLGFPSWLGLLVSLAVMALTFALFGRSRDSKNAGLMSRLGLARCLQFCREFRSRDKSYTPYGYVNYARSGNDDVDFKQPLLGSD